MFYLFSGQIRHTVWCKRGIKDFTFVNSKKQYNELAQPLTLALAFCEVDLDKESVALSPNKQPRQLS